MTPPFITLFSGDGEPGGAHLLTKYIFFAWALLILCAGLISQACSRHPATMTAPPAER